MNTETPKQSRTDKSSFRSWWRIDFIAAGLWVMIPIAVFAGRQILLPVFDDFGVELPASTRYLLSPYAPALLLIVYLMVLVLVFAGEDGTSRRRLSWIALTLGIIVVTACVLSILTPLLSLWRDLS